MGVIPASVAVWRQNIRLRRFLPPKEKARVVISALAPPGLQTSGKVNAQLYFPPFARVLGAHGVGVVYVHDGTGFEREVECASGRPVIVIDLVNEDRHDLDAHPVRREFLRLADAVFNSLDVARVLRNKEKTNRLLAVNGIPVPRLDGLAGKETFSNTRLGTANDVLVYKDGSAAPADRHNAAFICTRQEFRGKVYYTSVRLMCVGPHIVQVMARARDVDDNNPSVHNKDTPRDDALVDHLIARLIEPRLDDHAALAKKLATVLGPGFYAHDVLVDSATGELHVCESGFKFFDSSYETRLKGIGTDRPLPIGRPDVATYATRAAAIFLAYCNEMDLVRIGGSSALAGLPAGGVH